MLEESACVYFLGVSVYNYVCLCVCVHLHHLNNYYNSDMTEGETITTLPEGVYIFIGIDVCAV